MDSEGSFAALGGVQGIAGEEEWEDHERDGDEFEEAAAGVAGECEAGGDFDGFGCAEKVLDLDGDEGGEEDVDQAEGNVEFGGAEFGGEDAIGLARF